MILPDLLMDNLDFVFCDTAVGRASSKSEYYYRHSNNKFFKILYTLRLTKTLILPEKYTHLLENKIGLTDIAKNTIGNDAEISFQARDLNVFISKMKLYQPRCICFNGKKAASIFFKKPTINLCYGMQKECLGASMIYIACSTSSAAKRYWDESIWHNLRQII